MPKTKAQKQKILEDLKEKVARQKAMVFVDFTGVKVKDLSDFRKKLKKSNSEVKVAKKTLLSLALKDYNQKISELVKSLAGEVALVFGYQDEITPAKSVFEFSEKNKNLKILGGLIESQKDNFLLADYIVELAKLPSKEELLARLVGSIKAPVSNFVYALNYNLKGLVYLLSNIKK